MLEQWIQGVREAAGSPPTSLRTDTTERPADAQSVELHPSLSQISHAHSDITDRSFSLPDTGLYPNSPNYMEDHLYSEPQQYLDDIDSSVGYRPFRNGDVKDTSRRPSPLLVATRSYYPAFTASPDEVMFTSPMDVMPHAIYGSSNSQDGISSEMDPLNMHDSIWTWDGIDQPGSCGSTPTSTEFPWSPAATTKNTANYSPNQATHSLRCVSTHSTRPYLPHIAFC
jgi:hypothetical protein